MAALILAWDAAGRSAPALATAALALFAAAAFSDWLDGWLARRLKATSALGAALDHTADKALTASSLIALCLCWAEPFLAFAAIVLIARDLLLSGLREGLGVSGRRLPVDGLGKAKTVLTMAGITAALSAMALPSSPWSQSLNAAGQALVVIAAFVALVSAAHYVQRLPRRGV